VIHRIDTRYFLLGLATGLLLAATAGRDAHGAA